MLKAVLALADGTVVEGSGAGVEGLALGELVFCTAMTGYEEALTDPSYKGQILMFTYPLIGNYGAYTTELESNKIQAEGIVVSEVSRNKPEQNERKRFIDFLEDHGIPCIENVDTRMLTLKLRKEGTMPAALLVYYGKEKPNINELLEHVKRFSLNNLDLVSEVTRRNVEEIYVGGRKTVALIDYGVKRSIVKSLLENGVNLLIFPAKTHYSRVKAYNPDGVVLSNGPGDPCILKYAIENARKLIREYPTLGICLGHQITALALGARTYKLKFGHRGVNHPVKDLETGRVFITSHNHGYAVNVDSLNGTGLRVRQVSLNDHTVEALTHVELPILTTQYHPEGHPGPCDNYSIFGEFIQLLKIY